MTDSKITTALTAVFREAMSRRLRILRDDVFKMDNIFNAGIVKVPASGQHTATVIFLHGLGQSNLTWRIVATEALAPHLLHVEWVLPQASARPVTINQGQFRPSWFDIAHLPPYHYEHDEAGIAESVAVVESLILEQVHNGIDPRRIVVMGFSQGASLSMMAALTTLHELGGVASLSGWIPRLARDQMIHTEPNLPIFWGHGTDDDEIPIAYAEEAISFLLGVLHVPASMLLYRRYEGMMHTINDDELDDLSAWLIRVLG